MKSLMMVPFFSMGSFWGVQKREILPENLLGGPLLSCPNISFGGDESLAEARFACFLIPSLTSQARIVHRKKSCQVILNAYLGYAMYVYICHKQGSL